MHFLHPVHLFHAPLLFPSIFEVLPIPYYPPCCSSSSGFCHLRSPRGPATACQSPLEAGKHLRFLQFPAGRIISPLNINPLSLFPRPPLRISRAHVRNLPKQHKHSRPDFPSRGLPSLRGSSLRPSLSELPRKLARRWHHPSLPDPLSSFPGSRSLFRWRLKPHPLEVT